MSIFFNSIVEVPQDVAGDLLQVFFLSGTVFLLLIVWETIVTLKIPVNDFCSGMSHRQNYVEGKGLRLLKTISPFLGNSTFQ